MAITGVREKVRDGYINDLPEVIQNKIYGIHKMIVDMLNSKIDDDHYEDLTKSNWAMSCLDEFKTKPSANSEVGSVRVYKSGKTYRCMIQVTGHFTNHQYGWIEELLHEIIADTYQDVKPAIRKKYDVKLANESSNGSSFEGFDIFLSNKQAKEIWDKFEGRKTKTIRESVERPDDLFLPESLAFYYDNLSSVMSYEDYCEKVSIAQREYPEMVEDGNRLVPYVTEGYDDNNDQYIQMANQLSEDIEHARTEYLKPHISKLYQICHDTLSNYNEFDNVFIIKDDWFSIGMGSDESDSGEQVYSYNIQLYSWNAMNIPDKEKFYSLLKELESSSNAYLSSNSAGNAEASDDNGEGTMFWTMTEDDFNKQLPEDIQRKIGELNDLELKIYPDHGTETVRESSENFGESDKKSNLVPIYGVLKYTSFNDKRNDGSDKDDYDKEMTRFQGSIKWITKGDNYAHALVSFDDTFRHLYSFGDHGIEDDDIMNDSWKATESIYVCVMFVDKAERDKMKQYVDKLVDNPKETSYAYNNLLKAYTGKPTKIDKRFVCSTFTAYILMCSNPKNLHRDYSRLRPEDITILPRAFYVMNLKDQRDFTENREKMISKVKDIFNDHREEIEDYNNHLPKMMLTDRVDKLKTSDKILDWIISKM